MFSLSAAIRSSQEFRVWLAEVEVGGLQQADVGEVLFFLTPPMRLVLEVDAVASGEVLGDDHDGLALPEEMVEGVLRFWVLANHRCHLRVIEDDDEHPP